MHPVTYLLDNYDIWDELFKKGDLQYIEYLDKLNKLDNVRIVSGFSKACKYGHLELIKWIVSKKWNCIIDACDPVTNWCTEKKSMKYYLCTNPSRVKYKNIIEGANAAKVKGHPEVYAYLTSILQTMIKK